MRKKGITTTTYDRIQALIRNPEYLQDLNKFKKGLIDEETICKKYSLRLAIYPQWIFNLLRGKHSNIEKLESTQLFTDWIIQSKMTPVIEVNTKDYRDYFLRSGKYLSLEIDLTKKKEDIMRLVGTEIDIFQDYVIRTKRRCSKTTLDPWVVYDMKKRGMNFSQIAKKLSGLKNSPTYNDRLKAYHSQVIRAYKKAVKLIDEITPQ